MDILTKIKERENELQPIYQRMDDDKLLVYLDPYQLKDLKNAPLNNVVNVTMNFPQVFANAIASDLMTAILQFVVEGKISQTQTRDIEQYINDNLAMANEGLANRGMPELLSWLANHVCVRSLIGVRWIGQYIKGQYQVDCLPCDMRYTPFEFDSKGLAWAAHQSWRSRSDIEQEYEKYKPEVTARSKVIDHWDREVHTVFINANKLFDEENPWKEPPFDIVLPSSGFMLQDEDHIGHDSESLVSAIRGLVNELNRAVSIKQTLSMGLVLPAYEQEKQNPGDPADKPPQLNQTVVVGKGEKHQLVQRRDVDASLMTGEQDIKKALEQGGISDANLGAVLPQVTSALFVTEQVALSKKQQKPRIDALILFYKQLTRMMIKQHILGVKNKEVKIGATGRKNLYKAEQLGDPDTYFIDVRLMSKSKKEELSNLAMANAARGTLPLRDILTNILMHEDPDAVIRQLDMEQAKTADPVIGMQEMATSFAKEADELTGVEKREKRIAAITLAKSAINLIKRRDMEAITPLAPLQGKAQTGRLDSVKPDNSGLSGMLARRGSELPLGV